MSDRQDRRFYDALAKWERSLEDLNDLTEELKLLAGSEVQVKDLLHEVSLHSRGRVDERSFGYHVFAYNYEGEQDQLMILACLPDSLAWLFTRICEFFRVWEGRRMS